MMMDYDLVLLTDRRYLIPQPGNWYVENILLEDSLVAEALERKGLKVWRTHWDNPQVNWRQVRFALFRTTWDYFDRYSEFATWLRKTSGLTSFINSYDLIRWNMDKHYLTSLQQHGIGIPPTRIIEPQSQITLKEVITASGWNEVVLKPAISGAGRHTYKSTLQDAGALEDIFFELLKEEAWLLQEFQHRVATDGEIALMMMDGRFTHAVLKKAKAGDFRVQDDFGGTVHDYSPSPEEIHFAEKVIACCPSDPLYARVDVIRDNRNQLCVAELELIEPEMWFRHYPAAADRMAEAIMKKYF